MHRSISRWHTPNHSHARTRSRPGQTQVKPRSSPGYRAGICVNTVLFNEFKSCCVLICIYMYTYMYTYMHVYMCTYNLEYCVLVSFKSDRRSQELQYVHHIFQLLPTVTCWSPKDSLDILSGRGNGKSIMSFYVCVLYTLYVILRTVEFCYSVLGTLQN